MYEVIVKPQMVKEAGVIVQFQVPENDWNIIEKSEEWKALHILIDKAQKKRGLNLNLSKVY